MSKIDYHLPEKSDCDKFRERNLIEVKENAKLTLINTTISNFRSEYKSIISLADNTRLELIDSSFINLITNIKNTESGIIIKNCSFWRYNCGNIYISGGLVKWTNNGHTMAAQISSFLNLEGLETLEIKGVIFQGNIAE